MMKNKKYLTYQVKILLWCSVMLLMVILFISSMFYCGVRTAVREEIEKSGQKSLQLMKNATETMLRDLDRSMQSLVVDPAVVSFTEWAFRQDRDITFLMNFLKNKSKKVTGEFYLQSEYVYYFKDDTVLDIKNGRIRRLEDMYFIEDSHCTDETNKDGEMIRAVLDRQDGKFFSIVCVQTVYKSKVVVLVKPIMTGGNKKALLIAALDPEWFSNLFNSINGEEDEGLYIVDGDYNLISEKKAGVPAFLKPYSQEERKVLFGGEGGSAVLNKESPELIATYTASKQYDWKYMSVSSADAMYNNLRKITIRMVILSGFGVVFGLVLVFLVSKKLYRPIERLRDSLEQEPVPGEIKSRDILTISQGISVLRKDKKNLEELLEENLLQLKSEFLARLLYGQKFIGKESVWDKINFYHADIIPGRCYTVAILDNSLKENQVEKLSEKQSGVYYLYISEQIQSMTEHYKSLNVEIVYMENEYVTLILNIGKEKEDSNILGGFLDEVYQTLAQETESDITIGVGGTVYEIELAGRSYRQAKMACGYKLVMGGNQIIYREDMPEVSDWYSAYPYETEKNIMYYLKQGEYEKLENELELYFACIRKYMVRGEDIRYSAMQLLDGIIRFCRETASGAEEVLGKRSLYQEMIRLDTVDEIQKWFLTLYKTIQCYIAGKKEKQGSELMERVVQYIEANYMSQHIGMEQIAERFHFSISYLGKNFKYQTGKTVKEYITECRIREAMTLLRTSKHKICQTGDMVGYPNTQSFINVFKKYTGETPGEYQKRESERLEKQEAEDGKMESSI